MTGKYRAGILKTAASFLLLIVCSTPGTAFALASNNIAMDSPIYSYLDKLAGLGLVTGDVKGVRPYSRAEAARLYQEAADQAARLGAATPALAVELIERLRELLPREIVQRSGEGKAAAVDYNLVSAARLRYFYLDGVPRDYNRDVMDPGHQSAFGFIGGDLRPFGPLRVHTTGSEGTPLMENNEGVIYRRGSNAELRWDTEGFLSDQASVLVEPLLLVTPEGTSLGLQKGSLKLGGGGLELEVGRDANWFGPGFRGDTVLTDNAKNFDSIKLSSPEPVDAPWVKRYLGDLKYALIFSRFDQTGSGTTLRRPYFLGAKLALKPRPWYEVGMNFAREFGGPGFSSGSGSNEGAIFGGGYNDHANTLAGLDLRFRIPALRDSELYGEFSGEDNAGGVWPIVESYVAGFYIPCLTKSGEDDLRFEFFYGSVMLYGDWQFPAGYVYHGMTPGHSQGSSAQDFFLRYSHWFSARNNLALEYFHTERGDEGRLPGQQTERKNAGRAFWSFPLHGELDMNLMYGLERIENFNLVAGVERTNQVLKVELSYRY
jgi:hypothetical protein